MSIATFYARRLLAKSRYVSVQSLLHPTPPGLASNPRCFKLPALVEASVGTRCFQTTPPKLINPLLVAFIKPVSRVFAMVVGRRFRRWWRTLPESERLKFRNEFKKRSRVWIGLGVAALAGIAFAYQSHVEESPITKRRRFVALNKDQVEKIATSEFQQLSEEFSGLMLPETSAYYSRMTRVASRILRSNSDLKEISGRTWTVTVIDRGDKNAFVLPTGSIFVFSGMLDLCANDDQLSISISHEIAHTVCMAMNWDKGHGRNWKRVCALLGGSSARCYDSIGIEHKMMRKRLQYQYKATCGTVIMVSDVMHGKIQGGDTRRLVKSKGILNRECYTGFYK